MRVDEIAAWINEREAIRLRKQYLEDRISRADSHGSVNEPWPEADWWGKGYWTIDYLTDDEILRSFRFCNVRRQDDRVTRWIVKNISEPWADHEHLWLMLCIARTLNWPPTLQHLMDMSKQGIGSWPDSPKFNPTCSSWPEKFEGSDLTWALEVWKKEGNKTTTGAYMIRAESDPKQPWFHWSKMRYLAEIVIGQPWTHRWQFPSDGFERLEYTWGWLQEFRGWGPFMSYQAVIDMRWTRYLRDAPDIQTWAALGAGTTRGINRAFWRDKDRPLSQEEGLKMLLELRQALAEPGVLAPWVGGVPDLSDITNVSCEWDKYERVRLGEGRPRAVWVPGRGW